MRAVNRRTTGDITAEIIEEFVKENADFDAIGLKVYVCSSICFICNLDDLKMPLWGYQSENLEAIETIRKQVKKVQASLKAMPDMARFLLFGAEANEQVGDLPSAVANQKVEERGRRIVGTLAYLVGRCDQLIADRPGRHKASGYREELAAVEAFRLIRQMNLQPTNSSSSTSLLRRIASLLYEAMTGEHGRDLETACRNIFADEESLARASALPGIAIGRGGTIPT